MRLLELAKVIPGCEIHSSENPEIERIDFDSRQVKPGSLFVAIEGEISDGHGYLDSAFRNGAAAVVVQRRIPGLEDANFLLVPDSRTALALLSGKIAGYPDRDIDLVAVTGTNGKTTTVSILAEVFKAVWGASGLIGTLGGRIGDRSFTMERTTPEAPDIFNLLSDMKLSGCRAVAMEVSSHALELKRVLGMRFSAAAFTNLSQDHLDFHGDIESYFKAKAALFEEYDIQNAVINQDDPYGIRLINMTDAPLLKYSLKAEADVYSTNLQVNRSGIKMTARTPRGDTEIKSPLLGTFNASNLLCALAVVEAMDIPHQYFTEATSRFSGVPGRMERFDLDNRTVYIDYAHTPEALQQALLELRKITTGEVHLLFGCGGNRDKGKRPLMGRVAEEIADRIYVTNDNPRDEDPETIATEILKGMKYPRKAVKILDRRAAIVSALSKLPEQGALLIAGKGHEDYQEIRGKRIHFDDREVVRSYTEGLA